MSSDAYLADIQRYFANIGITASALRNLGASGVVKSAREFLASVDLNRLCHLEPREYPHWLEEQTQLLMQAFPVNCRTYWGPARKAINIFMTMVALSHDLRDEYRLDRLEDVMETPLDGIAQKKLSEWGVERQLEIPKWTSIKALDRANSDQYQAIALDLAQTREIPRGRLDILIWEPLRV